MPKARPALHGGRAGAGDAVYFPAHRPARTRPARWPGCGPLRGGPEMPPTCAARSSLPLAAATLERAIAHNARYTSVESPAPDTAYNATLCAPETLPGAPGNAEGGTIALFLPFTGAAPVRGPCLISGFPAAVCGVRRHRRQDGASAASSREPVQLRCRGSWSEGSGGPLSECVPGLHGGRAAGDDRAETPGPLLRRRS